MTWTPDQAARLASDGIRNMPYDGGPPWNPAECVEHLTPEAQRLAAVVRSTFPWVSAIGTTRCSPNTGNANTVSIHGLGRALDVMVPEPSGSDGAALANWAVVNSPSFGIQLVIWDHLVWQGSLPVASRFAPYRGRNPHVDHVHIEVTRGGTGTIGPSSSSSSSGSGISPALVIGSAALLWFLNRSRRKPVKL